MKGFQTLRRIVGQVQQDDCVGLAAEMAYNWMLALMPLLIFLFSMFGLLTLEAGLFEQLLGHLSRVMPDDAYSVMSRTLSEVIRGSSGGLVIVSLLGALWASSNGAMVVIKALNRAYNCEEDTRPFWRKRLISIAIVLGIAIIMIVLFNLLVFGGQLINWLVDWLGLDYNVAGLLHVARWGVTLGGLILITLYIYTLAPALKIPFRQWYRAWPGTLAFVLLWMAVSWGFNFYVSNLGNYSRVYGAMGGIVILMIWLYFSSLALLLGGELNGMLLGEKRTSGPDCEPAT